MSADGSWYIAIETPMGTRHTTCSFESAGGELTGTQSEGGDSTAITDGTVNGNELSWKVAIAKPMPMTLTFTGKLDGDLLSGSADTGMFGSFSFSGTRV